MTVQHRERRVLLTQADIKLGYCFAVDFSGKSTDCGENRTEDPTCGSASQFYIKMRETSTFQMSRLEQIKNQQKY